VLDLAELGDDRLDGALHVALDHDVEVLHAAGLHLLEELLERDAAAARLLRQRLTAEALSALLRELAGTTLVLDDATELAGRRRLVEAEDLHGFAWERLLDALAEIVVQRTHAAPGIAATIASPTLIVPRWMSIVATGPRPTSSRDSMIGPDASTLAFARRSSSASATSRMRLEQVVEVLSGLAETRATCTSPPHSSGCRPSVASSLRTRSGLESGKSILLIATTIGTSAARAMGDRLLRLRHDAVVCCDDEHCDVGHLAPRARMAVNASWPGVSRNVIRRPSWSAW